MDIDGKDGIDIDELSKTFNDRVNEAFDYVIPAIERLESLSQLIKNANDLDLARSARKKGISYTFARKKLAESKDTIVFLQADAYETLTDTFNVMAKMEENGVEMQPRLKEIYSLKDTLENTPESLHNFACTYKTITSRYG